MIEMAELQRYYDNLLKEQRTKHDELVCEVERKTDIIKYSDNVLLEFYPYENEMYGLKKGVEVDKPNEIDKDIMRNYFDTQGFLIMTENVLVGDRVTSRSFYSYTEKFAERISFQNIGTFRLKSVARVYKMNNNIILFNKGTFGEGIWYFNYRNGLLDNVSIKEKSASEHIEKTRSIQCMYNNDNTLIVIINRYENGTEQVMYKRKKNS